MYSVFLWSRLVLSGKACREKLYICIIYIQYTWGARGGGGGSKSFHTILFSEKCTLKNIKVF